MMRRLLQTFLLFVAGASAVSAQSSAEDAVRNANDQFTNIKNRSIELERVKREANKRPARTDAARFPEIKKDFEEIQKMTTGILELTAAKTPVDYAAVLRFVSEINHRAVRLKSNLFSDEAKENQPAKTKSRNADKETDVKTLVEELGKSVNSFAHNSMFQNTNLVNSNDSLKAQSDLEKAIKISASIKEKARKLTKGDSKN